MSCSEDGKKAIAGVYALVALKRIQELADNIIALQKQATKIVLGNSTKSENWSVQTQTSRQISSTEQPPSIDAATFERMGIAKLFENYKPHNPGDDLEEILTEVSDITPIFIYMRTEVQGDDADADTRASDDFLDMYLMLMADMKTLVKTIGYHLEETDSITKLVIDMTFVA